MQTWTCIEPLQQPWVSKIIWFHLHVPSGFHLRYVAGDMQPCQCDLAGNHAPSHHVENAVVVIPMVAGTRSGWEHPQLHIFGFWQILPKGILVLYAWKWGSMASRSELIQYQIDDQMAARPFTFRWPCFRVELAMQPMQDDISRVTWSGETMDHINK